MGITNQRETLLLWERTSGQPVYNAITTRMMPPSGLLTTTVWASVDAQPIG
jgi:glycerol kinase